MDFPTPDLRAASRPVRFVRIVAVMVLPAALTACYNAPVENVAVWSEFLPLTEVRAQLDTLSRFGAGLYLAIRPDDLNDELQTFLNDARDMGVPVRPWFQLPDDGIWVNEANVDAFVQFADRFIVWAEENSIPVEWVIFDLEPSLEYLQELTATAGAGGLSAVIDLLNEHRNAEVFAAAQRQLQQAIDRLHQRNVRVMAVIHHFAIDDLEDGDADLQDMFDTPLTQIDWDQISVMAYRPLFSESLGVSLSAAYVARYAESMNAWYADRAQVAVGPISTVGVMVSAGYTDPTGLVMDVSAARSAGVNDISIFSLDGMVVEGGPEMWLAAVTGPTSWNSYPDWFVSITRWATASFDRSLEPQ